MEKQNSIKIIAGLGNPGNKYKKTRHNIGFMVLDQIVEQNSLNWEKNKKFNAEICRWEKNILVKPLTFMNNSGISIQKIMSYYNLLPKKLGLIKKKNCDLSSFLTVIHDELDIEFGNIKLSTNRGAAGHNGIKSIIQHLKSKNFNRIRIGIKNDNLKTIPVLNFVLQKFSKEEEQKINEKIIFQILKKIHQKK